MMISSVRSPITEPVKTFFVPALAVSALINDFEKHHSEHHQAIALANAMTGIGCSVYLYRLDKRLLAVIAGVAMFARARKQKSFHEKTNSVKKDLVWMGSGLAALECLSGQLNQYRERRGYVHNCLAFTIGALIIAPFINNRILGLKSGHDSNGGDSFHSSHPKAYPISMDRYGILTKLVAPLGFKKHDEESSQH